MALKLLPYQNLAAARFGRERNCSDSNPSHKLGNMPKGLEEEITGVSNVCYTLHHGALRVWKRIELHDTQTKAVFY